MKLYWFCNKIKKKEKRKKKKKKKEREKKKKKKRKGKKKKKKKKKKLNASYFIYQIIFRLYHERYYNKIIVMCSFLVSRDM